MHREAAWQGESFPGLELCRLEVEDGQGRLEGSVAYADAADGAGNGLLSYRIDLAAPWRTTRVEIRRLPAFGAPTTLLLTRDEAGRWSIDGSERSDLAACADVDLEFSPSTNTLPIRRLELAVGDSAPVAAAWVRFADLTVEVIEQTYERVGELGYRYRAGSFTADLEVDDAGLVLDYPGLWRRVGAG